MLAPAGAANRCRDVAGTWAWFNGQEVLLTAGGGAATQKPGILANHGRWRCLDTELGRIQVTWTKGGFVDTLTLSGDGGRLAGNNQYGIGVSASLMQRAAAPAAEAPSPRPSERAGTRKTASPRPAGPAPSPTSLGAQPTPLKQLKPVEPVRP
jgi:hypothetical protein